MPLQVTVVADHWPKETTWVVVDTVTEKVLVEGLNDDLIPGEPVEWLECINNKLGCYEFTIKDSGGDGKEFSAEAIALRCSPTLPQVYAAVMERELTRQSMMGRSLFPERHSMTPKPRHSEIAGKQISQLTSPRNLLP